MGCRQGHRINNVHFSPHWRIRHLRSFRSYLVRLIPLYYNFTNLINTYSKRNWFINEFRLFIEHKLSQIIHITVWIIYVILIINMSRYLIFFGFFGFSGLFMLFISNKLIYFKMIVRINIFKFWRIGL